jgi:mono/diheme cytochrome c family protein
MKNIPSFLLLFSLCAIFCASPSGNRQTPGLSWAGESQSVPGPDTGAMRKFYEEQCKSCHGETGKGDGPLSRILTAPVGNLADPKMWEKSDEQLLNIICRGKPPMPAYLSDLGEEGCRAMVDYVRTFAPEP